MGNGGYRSFKIKDGSTKKYYKQVDQSDLDQIRDKISSVVTQGYNEGLLTDLEFDCMLPGETTVGRLYGLAKDHKQFIKLPELRPICGINGTMTESLSRFVDYHSRDIVNNIPSRLEDSRDFLIQLELFRNV